LVLGVRAPHHLHPRTLLRPGPDGEGVRPRPTLDLGDGVGGGRAEVVLRRGVLDRVAIAVGEVVVVHREDELAVPGGRLERGCAGQLTTAAPTIGGRGRPAVVIVEDDRRPDAPDEEEDRGDTTDDPPEPTTGGRTGPRTACRPGP